MFKKLEYTPLDQSSFLYGTITCVVSTWRDTLGKGEQIFSFDSQLRRSNPLH